MGHPAPLLTSVLLIIILSRILGQIMVRMGQPALIGEIISGIILGPALFKMVQPSDPLSGIAKLSVFLIVFSAGLEMDFHKVLKAFKGLGLVIAAISFFFPLICGIAVGQLFGLDAMRTLFLGLCISITALPVAVKILEGFHLLDSAIARYSVSTAVLNDIACLMALGVLVDMPDEKSIKTVALSIGTASGKLILFGVLIILIYFGLKRLRHWGINVKEWVDRMVGLFGQEVRFGMAVVFVLAFSAASTYLGFHSVIGAFFGALLIDRDIFGMDHFSSLQDTVNSVATGFLSPIYFAYLGLEFQPGAIQSVALVFTVLLVSVGSKILAGYWGGLLAKMSRTEALGMGIIFNSRGVMELVVANIALDLGFIGPGLFSVLVLMGIVTTVITPPLFKRFYFSNLEKNETVVSSHATFQGPQRK